MMSIQEFLLDFFSSIIQTKKRNLSQILSPQLGLAGTPFR